MALEVPFQVVLKQAHRRRLSWSLEVACIWYSSGFGRTGVVPVRKWTASSIEISLPLGPKRSERAPTRPLFSRRLHLRLSDNCGAGPGVIVQGGDCVLRLHNPLVLSVGRA